MPYFDGFVIAVPTANREKFVAHALHFDRMLMSEGAVRVIECWGEDVPHGKQTDFYGAVNATEDETVCFSWVEWPDKATRNACHAKMEELMKTGEFGELAGEHADMPFDGMRMVFGGFEPVVTKGDLGALPYVQGFIVPVPKDRREDYARVAREGWDQMFGPYGATCLLESWADDVPHGKVTDFYRAVQAGDDETVVFSFMGWPSKQACDEAAERMKADTSLSMPDDMPFDAKRMVYGGFLPVVQLPGANGEN